MKAILIIIIFSAFQVRTYVDKLFHLICTEVRVPTLKSVHSEKSRLSQVYACLTFSMCFPYKIRYQYERSHFSLWRQFYKEPNAFCHLEAKFTFVIVNSADILEILQTTAVFAKLI